MYSSNEPPPMEETPKHFAILCDWEVTDHSSNIHAIQRENVTNYSCEFHIVAKPTTYEAIMRKLGISPARITFYVSEKIRFKSKYGSTVIYGSIPVNVSRAILATTHSIYIPGTVYSHSIPREPYQKYRIKYVR
jgi:hypothetical protein